MKRIVVSGGRRLSGEVKIGGSKNAALPILFAGIVTGDACVFSNLPRVSDVLQTLEILKFLGARIQFMPDGDIRVDYTDVSSRCAPHTMTGAIRGSTYLLGAMLSRFGKAELRGAGGCDFGSRPIDQHLMGFERMGANACYEESGVLLEAPFGLCGADISLAMPSVGATANLMIAASLAKGETVIRNAAAEPHVAALGAFLCEAGAHISGIGTDTIRVIGARRLHGTHSKIIPDMIEAGTYLCAGVACGGPVCVQGVCPAHLTPLLNTFSKMGVQIEAGECSITVSAFSGYQGVDVITGPFPAFPTDLHPQITALMCLGNRARGKGSVTELVFESRFRYIEELRRMGAKVTVQDRCAHIQPSVLHANRLRSPDLRGGAALLLAALATNGQSEITNAATIGRGYEHLEEKLRALGACVSVY